MKKIFFMLLIMVLICSSLVFAENTVTKESIPPAPPAEMPTDGEMPRMPRDGMRGIQQTDENAFSPDFPMDNNREGFRAGRRGPGGNMNGIPFEDNQQTEQATQSKSLISLLTQNYFTHISTIVFLFLGFLFVIFYKR